MLYARFSFNSRSLSSFQVLGICLKSTGAFLWTDFMVDLSSDRYRMREL
jgi:hypothetical protein